MTDLHRTPVFVTVMLIATLFGASGCSASGPRWVDENASYTVKSVENVLTIADISAQSRRPTTQATELRHEALTALRKKGESASRAADLLTATFDPETRAVPVYVESASLGGKPVLVVVEATGPKSGMLSMKRLWVLGEDGSVVLARSRWADH